MDLRQLQVLYRRWYAWLFAAVAAVAPSTTVMLSMQSRAQLLDELLTLRLAEVNHEDQFGIEVHLVRILDLIKGNVKL